METLVQTSPPAWTTIAEVSEALGIHRATIQTVVRKARERAEGWVDRMPYPSPGSSLRWLIDTNHVTYQYYERRWRKLAQKASKQQASTEALAHEQSAQQEDALPCSDPAPTEATPELIADRAICQWLASQGLVVSVNILDPASGWQWFWNGTGETGYPDATTALFAALDCCLTGREMVSSPDLVPVVCAPEPEPPLWQRWFHKKKQQRTI